MDLIQAFTNEQLKENVPVIRIGDTVRIHNKIKEGARERLSQSMAAASRRPSRSDVCPTAAA